MRLYGWKDDDANKAPRMLTPEEAAQVEVVCALCGADLFPVQLGYDVQHDCQTGEVKP